MKAYQSALVFSSSTYSSFAVWVQENAGVEWANGVQINFFCSRGPNAAEETAKGKIRSEEKGLWPQPLRISLPGLTSHGRSQGSKSGPDTNMEVRFSTAEARGPSLRFRVFLLLSLH